MSTHPANRMFGMTKQILALKLGYCKNKLSGVHVVGATDEQSVGQQFKP